MKRLLPLLLLLLLLSACNLPENATQQPDLVATNVAAILTDQPANTYPVMTEITPEPTKTTLSEEIQTPVPPTSTESLPTVLPVTPQPTTAPTQTPSATAAAGDPALLLGNAAKVEDFNDNSAWNFDDNWVSLSVSDGQLHITSKGTPYWNSWYTILPKIQNFYLETTLAMPTCGGKDRVGLAFRLNDNSEFYFYALTCDGMWSFNRYTTDNQIVTILKDQTSTELKPVSEWNRLGVMAKGDNFEFYINGVKVGQATDDTLPNAGTTGFISMAEGTSAFKTDVDKLAYWLIQ